MCKRVDGNNKHSNQYSTNSLTMNILPAHAMATQIECPAKYQIYIDLGRGKHVNHVIHNYFKIVKVGQGEGSVGICKKCDKKVFFERNSSILVEHLKTDHPTNYREGWNYSYPHYIKILGEVLFQTSTDFPEVKKDKMKTTFGVRHAEGASIIRFPESRKGRLREEESKISENVWQGKIFKTYNEHPVGSFQGHFDRPIGSLLIRGKKALSFAEYTQYTHTPADNCHTFEVDLQKYKELDNLMKIESLKVVEKDSTVGDLKISGPCSRNDNQKLIYTCVKSRCLMPCVCKDCVLEEGQCDDHDILHPGYFDKDAHAFTVRSHDSVEFNRIGRKELESGSRGIQIVKYAGIENDDSVCVQCPQDVLHHQAYHLVHHDLCKFCRNEKHKYENVTSVEDCFREMKRKHFFEQVSCHICNKLFSNERKKRYHIETQHNHDKTKGFQCKECDKMYQSKQGLEYHMKVQHAVEQETHHCPVCIGVFTTKHGLDVHVRSTHFLRKVSCEFCNSEFTRQTNLYKHFRDVHGFDAKKYSQNDDDDNVEFHHCNDCEFFTKFRSNLDQHIRFIHAPQDMLFTCNQCDFTTVYKRNFHVHITLHRDQQKYQCDQCDFKTTYKRNLNAHVKVIHSGESSSEQVFICNLCNFKTNYSRSLKRHNEKMHELKHNKKQIYFCDRCEYHSFSEDALEVHKQNTPH